MSRPSIRHLGRHEPEPAANYFHATLRAREPEAVVNFASLSHDTLVRLASHYGIPSRSGDLARAVSVAFAVEAVDEEQVMLSLLSAGTQRRGARRTAPVSCKRSREPPAKLTARSSHGSHKADEVRCARPLLKAGQRVKGRALRRAKARGLRVNPRCW